MRIIVACDKFKDSLDAAAVCDAITAGVRSARPDAAIDCVPMADGGEGTLDILLTAKHGQRRWIEATGPLGERRTACMGLIDGAATAVIELAQIAGLSLVPPDCRDPLKTTTFGVGELMAAAMDAGVERILLAVGGSATVDGGAGMLQALGARLFDRQGREMSIADGGGRLNDIGRIDLEGVHSLSIETGIVVAVDVLNPLCGHNGAARAFARQKGADDAGVALLEAGLSHWAGLLENLSGRDVRGEPGTGAAGGVAAPLVALFDSEIVPGVDLAIAATGLSERIARADLVITGEGRLDGQSAMGKVVSGVARLARGAGVRCVGIVGSLGRGHEACDAWLDEIVSLSSLAGSVESSISDAARWLAVAGAQAVSRE